MNKAAEYIKSKISGLNLAPKTGIILGSGLGELAQEIDGVSIPYSDIPGFRTSSVQGHEGSLVVGNLCGKTVVAMKGRFHFYEGHSMSDVIFPIRVMKLLGIEQLIVTNAAGGVNTGFKPGDLMLIKDHINMLGTNPLIGKNFDELGPRFPDMSQAYNKDLLRIAKKVANELGVEVREGVYTAVTGPCYETPAEVRMLRTLGTDAVGMSTVPEVITANHMRIKVLGISCITNMACGILDKPLSHDEVIETTNVVKQNFSKLVKTIVSLI